MLRRRAAHDSSVSNGIGASESSGRVLGKERDMYFRQFKSGVVGGLLGGLVFGALMGAMGMLPMVGQLVGLPTSVAGFFVHMVIAAIIGGGYALISRLAARTLRSGIHTGIAYGFFWWFLGPLTLMPLFLGQGLGVSWNVNAMQNGVPSLVGHLLFGLVLGASYARLTRLERQRLQHAHA